MQKVFIAVVLALALCSATAKYTTENANFVKAPVPICTSSNDTACTNATTLELAGLAAGDVSLVAKGDPTFDKNSSNAAWKIFTAKIASKDLTTSGNVSYNFNAPTYIFFSQGYALSIMSEKSSDNITNLYLYQTKLEGATTLPRVPLTTNTDKNFTPSTLGFSPLGKNIAGAVLVADKKANVSTIAVGGASVTKEFTLTTAFPNTTSSLQFASGEALGDSKLLAVWNDGAALKQSVVDFSKATAAAPADVAGLNTTAIPGCQAFSTDKTVYGVICSSQVNNTMTIHVATLNNNSALVNLTQLNDNSAIANIFPYAGYVAIVTSNTTNGTTIYSKSIWNLDTKAAFLNATKIVTADAKTDYSIYRVPGAGVYGLFWNRENSSVPRTDIVVGQVLSGSYLTTVFGFLMTIVAGLLLF